MGASDLIDHGRRIALLERKVSELYKRLGQAEPGDAFGGGFGDEPGAADFTPAEQDPRLIELVQTGNTIQAIKLYRELTGLGLAESKDAVDKLEATYRPTG